MSLSVCVCFVSVCAGGSPGWKEVVVVVEEDREDQDRSLQVVRVAAL